MNIWTILGAGTVINILLSLFVSRRAAKIEQVKLIQKSDLTKEIKGKLDEWKNQIKLDFLPDGRIKIIFPQKLGDTEIFFYLSQHDDRILISEHGELLKRTDFGKTPNKIALGKISGMLGINFDSKDNQLYINTDMDHLDEKMWSMLFGILLLEYVTY